MKKWGAYFLGLLLAAGCVAAGYVGIKTSYRGNQSVVLLNAGGTYTSFQDIIKRPEFANKVVYVDVWGTSCLPCFDELENHTPALTKRYAHNQAIAFLYVCIDRHPLPEVRWKDKLQQFKPAGYHVLVEAEQEAKLAKDIVGQAVRGRYFPYAPYYFMVDKHGRIVGQPVANPEQGELRPSDRQRLYAKLDSLIAS